MTARIWLPTGAFLMGIAVIMGALGAHGLHARLAINQTLEFYETAVRFHMFHAVGLMVVGLAARPGAGRRWLSGAGWLMLLGIVLFSGSLYALGLTGLHWLGLVTPFGGVCMIAAWIALAVGTLTGSSATAG